MFLCRYPVRKAEPPLKATLTAHSRAALTEGPLSLELITMCSSGDCQTVFLFFIRRAESPTYVTELRAVRKAGVTVELDASNSNVIDPYAERPLLDIWAIGIYQGESPIELSPVPGLRNPVLTRDDVTDCVALFVADPFITRTHAGWFMFMEVMDAGRGMGQIGLAFSRDGLQWKYKQIVLIEPYHLSYPYVFETEGNYYLIPESFQAHGVHLYQATHFPTDWKFFGTLISAPYIVDSSIFHYQGQWWLWADTSPQQRHDTLRLFFATDLLGPWKEHPLSPVITGDATAARPAGRAVFWNGNIIRFAQNCERSYGTAVRAFQVTNLSSSTFSERPCCGADVIGPSRSYWNSAGMHHIDPQPVEGGHWLAAVDGCSRQGQQP
jgi:hypothetical protein